MAGLAQIKFRRGTSAAWAAAGTVLAEGEPGFDTTLRRVKVGNGVGVLRSVRVSGLIKTAATGGGLTLTASQNQPTASDTVITARTAMSVARA